MATGFLLTLSAGLVGTAVACGVRARRTRTGEMYAAAELEGIAFEGTRMERVAGASASFAMPAPELSAKNWLDPSEIRAAIDARVTYFEKPAARLEGGVLIVELGPARRAILPVTEIAALAAARPHDLRRRKSMARYVKNQRRPAVLIDLRRPREVLHDRLRVVSSLLVEVHDLRGFLESLGRVSGLELGSASMDLLA